MELRELISRTSELAKALIEEQELQNQQILTQIKAEELAKELQLLERLQYEYKVLNHGLQDHTHTKINIISDSEDPFK